MSRPPPQWSDWQPPVNKRKYRVLKVNGQITHRQWDHKRGPITDEWNKQLDNAAVVQLLVNTNEIPRTHLSQSRILSEAHKVGSQPAPADSNPGSQIYTLSPSTRAGRVSGPALSHPTLAYHTRNPIAVTPSNNPIHQGLVNNVLFPEQSPSASDSHDIHQAAAITGHTHRGELAESGHPQSLSGLSNTYEYRGTLVPVVADDQAAPAGTKKKRQGPGRVYYYDRHDDLLAVSFSMSGHSTENNDRHSTSGDQRPSNPKQASNNGSLGYPTTMARQVLVHDHRDKADRSSKDANLEDPYRQENDHQEPSSTIHSRRTLDCQDDSTTSQQDQSGNPGSANAGIRASQARETDQKSSTGTDRPSWHQSGRTNITARPIRDGPRDPALPGNTGRRRSGNTNPPGRRHSNASRKLAPISEQYPFKTNTKKIRGGDVGGEREELDERYCVRYSHFYEKGRVFAMLWHESDTSNHATEPGEMEGLRQYSVGRFEVRIYTTVRRMVVVREAKGFSLCVPIVTYGHQGVNKPGIPREEAVKHTAIHMSDVVPFVADAEREKGMNKDPIAVNAAKADQKLLPMSRLNLGKIYAVEHNVKVMDVGTIKGDSYRRLMLYYANTHA